MVGKHDEEELDSAMDPVFEDENEHHDEFESEKDPQLLDAVLRETVGSGSRGSLELIFGVARASQYPDTSQIEAVEEVVLAIVQRKFGKLRFPRRLIQGIAGALIEVPEAAVKLERLWQEARARG